MAPGKTLLGLRGILSNAVTDKPIESASEDKLAFTPVVEALSTFLRHTATKPSLSIAINAAWGMGKSSFMNMLAGSLKKGGAQPVQFNVWHHQHEEVLLAPLLQAIVNQAIPGWALWAGWRFRARLWLERCRRWDWAFWLGSLAPVALLAYLVWLALRAWSGQAALPLGMIDEAVRDLHTLVTMLTSGQWQASVKNGSLWEVAAAALMAVSSDLVNALTVLGMVLLVVSWVMLFSYTLRPFPASPAILVASLDKKFSLSKAEAQTDFRQRFRRHFGQVARALQPKTMVVFIDDLDRCKPEKAAELLEAANYLSDAGPCFIILGIAREIVEAQVANAHKVVAEEQAAMKRVRLGQAAAKDSSGDKDRLEYAQKYLRKLVQLDVALPRLDATRSIQLLLGKLGAGAAQTAPPEKTPWISPHARGIVLLWLMLIGVGSLVLWRTWDIRDVLKIERETKVVELNAHAAQLRKNVEAARVYANWLGSPAGEKAAGVASPAAPVPASPASAASGSAVLYKAKADMMQSVLRDLEAGLAALEREAGEGQEETFKKLKKKAFDPSYEVFKAYTASPQIDGRAWLVIEAGLRPAVKTEVNLSTDAKASSIGRADLDVRKATVSARPTAVAENPLWDPNMGLFIAALVTLFLAIFRAKDNYEVQPTPEYEAAVAKWQKQLLQNRDTASPRELKRFMNLSRYAVARLQTATGGAGPGQKKSAKLPITETRVVELTAKWLANEGKLNSNAMRGALGIDGATPDEVALFLEIVGDLDESAGGGGPVDRVDGAETAERGDRSDRQEDV